MIKHEYSLEFNMSETSDSDICCTCHFNTSTGDGGAVIVCLARNCDTQPNEPVVIEVDKLTFNETLPTMQDLIKQHYA